MSAQCTFSGEFPTWTPDLMESLERWPVAGRCTSDITPLRGYEVELAVALITIITLANLRGAKESGRLFAPPTYLYVAIMTLLVVWGLFQTFTGSLHPLPVNHKELDHFTGGETMLGGVTFFLLLRAFSSGAVALSGVEAISNGIQAFRKPESRNAAITLMWTAFLLGSLFVGIAVLADQLQPTLSESQTILSTMGRAVFGQLGTAAPDTRPRPVAHARRRPLRVRRRHPTRPAAARRRRPRRRADAASP